MCVEFEVDFVLSVFKERLGEFLEDVLQVGELRGASGGGARNEGGLLVWVLCGFARRVLRDPAALPF